MITDLQVFQVSELNAAARLLLEDTFPLIWVEGEISNLACPTSGHIYFSLKDTRAQVRCAFFQQRSRRTSLTLKNGMHVFIQAKVSLYEGRGDFQLIVEQCEEVGDGVLQRAFEQLKQKLSTEGLFDAQHKKKLPLFPKCIGVITSSRGAAIHDILSVLKRRFPSIPVIIYPTLVQGVGAASQIAETIACSNQRAECDVLILARGGGSLEDLWSFNEEIVARAIFASKIPIISGIGHEIDITISDFVADQRAATPSAAAELITPDGIEYLFNLSQIAQRLEKRIFSMLSHYYDRVGWANKHLQLCHPGQRLQAQTQRLDYLEQQLVGFMRQSIVQLRQKIENAHQLLAMVNPLATLQRGYAIVTDANGHVIRQAEHVNIGDHVQAQLQKGIIHCKVEEKPCE